MIENQRIFLYAALGFISLLLFQTWQADYGPKPELRAGTESVATPGVTATAPEGTAALPSVTGESANSSMQAGTPATAATNTAASLGKRINVETDLAKIEVDTAGGTIVSVLLKDYPVAIDQPDVPFALVSDKRTEFLVAQSGLSSATQGLDLPGHATLYTSESNNYELSSDANEIVVPLEWESNGVKVIKTITFKRNSYQISVNYDIQNQTAAPVAFTQYYRLERKPVTSDETSQFVRTYTGAVISTEEEVYQKVDFDDMEDEDLQIQTKGGWIAMIQHYFGAAWIPPQEEANVFFSKYIRSLDQDHYVIAMNSAPVSIEAGAGASVGSTAFIGPKVQDLLKEAAPKLELSVDFGWLTILAQPLFWLLKNIHAFVGNWGWAIIFLTCLIKLFFYPLSQAGYKSMARMKKLQPKMTALKERHGDDRAEMGRATMELYKKEKVNPLGGCLPMLVQIPVFIALYWMLIESVELRQAPWALWIKDLADKDPFFVLPVIMGITMFIQQKLNPAPADPIQAKVFMFLPFVFTAFFAFFPAGLVLYWIVNNTLSIAQQYYITHHVIGVDK